MPERRASVERPWLGSDPNRSAMLPQVGFQVGVVALKHDNRRAT
jgi:hypothetical protein